MFNRLTRITCDNPIGNCFAQEEFNYTGTKPSQDIYNLLLINRGWEVVVLKKPIDGQKFQHFCPRCKKERKNPKRFRGRGR